MPALVGPPLVGIVCDREMAADGMQSHRAGSEYVAAVQGIGALPLLIPVTEPPPDIAALLVRLDGLLFTGAPSNVSPTLYGGPAPRPGTRQDPARDATGLALLKAAIDAGLPTLCICRGFQELNVVLGGTLAPHVHETPGRLDHREKPDAPPAEQYGPAHAVTLAPGGILAGLLAPPPDGGKESKSAEVTVNSLHHQGIARLAPGLLAEAHAPDGLVEAASLPGARGFLLGVQWHPEWAAAHDPVSRAIFQAFRQAMTG
jgi:putative glutamine amidotransferase